MRRFIGLSSLAAIVLTLPFITSAADAFSVLVMINRFLNGLVGIIITIAIVVFFWGLVGYLTRAGDDRHKGLITMFYSLIAIFVMVSIWGIIHLLQNTFGVAGQNQAIIPQGIGISP